MIFTIIAALLFATLLGWFFVRPHTYVTLCRLFEEKER